MFSEKKKIKTSKEVLNFNLSLTKIECFNFILICMCTLINHLCCSYDNGTRDASYSIGLQGIKKDDYPMVVETIQKTFDKVIE